MACRCYFPQDLHNSAPRSARWGAEMAVWVLMLLNGLVIEILLNNMDWFKIELGVDDKSYQHDG